VLLRVWTSSQRCAETGSGMTTYYVPYLITLLSLVSLFDNSHTCVYFLLGSSFCFCKLYSGKQVKVCCLSST